MPHREARGESSWREGKRRDLEANLTGIKEGEGDLVHCYKQDVELEVQQGVHFHVCGIWPVELPTTGD